MAGGNRFKFQGSNISFLTGFTGTPGTITGITNANPAVVTQTAHGYASGDVVQIEDVVGMTEVNGVFVVENLTANTYALVDVNATDYGVYASDGTATAADMSRLCELTGYNRQGGSSPEIQATSQCSTAQEFELGLPDFGTVQVDYNFAPQTGVQKSIEAYYRSGDLMASKVVLPNSGGIMVQLGYVQQTSESASVGGLWTGSFTMRATGPRVDFAAP